MDEHKQFGKGIFTNANIYELEKIHSKILKDKIGERVTFLMNKIKIMKKEIEIMKKELTTTTEKFRLFKI
tara:strand:- start:332 stop:541 length:210 start_codon:yes stop_codon:yes gene_type:complete